MNQIKYPIYACLMILVCVLVFDFFYKLSSTNIRNETTVYQQKSESNFPKPDVIKGPYSKGYKVFSENCATCHQLDKVVTGPALRGVEDRGPWTDRKALIKWVHNPGVFIPTNPYTKELQQEYGQIMPSFPQLTEKDIHAIFDYIKNAPTSVPVSSPIRGVAALY
jgi:mono/diheme cytochrome c family protein